MLIDWLYSEFNRDAANCPLVSSLRAMSTGQYKVRSEDTDSSSGIVGAIGETSGEGGGDGRTSDRGSLRHIA
jgi:hypothetical protein